jgi:hypothetical protein
VGKSVFRTSESPDLFASPHNVCAIAKADLDTFGLGFDRWQKHCWRKDWVIGNPGSKPGNTGIAAS